RLPQSGGRRRHGDAERRGRLTPSRTNSTGTHGAVESQRKATMSKGRRPKRPKDPLRLTHRTVRGHLGWAVPASLGLVLAAWLATLFAQFQSAAEDVAEPEVLESNAQILEAVIIAVLVMTLLVSLPGLRSVWRSWRRSRLAFSKAEREVVDHRRAQRHWWTSAAALRRAAAGDGIPQIDSPR